MHNNASEDYDELTTSLMQELERVMEKQSVTRAELARRLDCSRAYVSGVLNGDKVTVKALARCFDVLGHRLTIRVQRKPRVLP